MVFIINIISAALIWRLPASHFDTLAVKVNEIRECRHATKEKQSGLTISKKGGGGHRQYKEMENMKSICAESTA